ncbi:MAG: 4'-phosphopantetheinyl transferase family protein [Aquaticitalea sp.]
MIGNDIIDLSVAGVHSRWQEKRFLDTLFSVEEQAMITADENRFHNIWRLWSMKESAYKIYSRTLKSSIFNPTHFNCNINSETSGTVSFDKQIINTTTECNANVIYSTANLQNIQLNTSLILEGHSQFEKAQFLREKAIHEFAKLKAIDNKDVSIKKDRFAVPHFCIKEKAQDTLLTLTHHGSYGGFAISY